MDNQNNHNTPLLDEILEALVQTRSDEEAWKSLYVSMWPFVFGVTYRSLRAHSQLAEDASQEVFLRLVRYCPFDRLCDPGAFKAYLYSVSRNVARDYLARILGRNADLALQQSPKAQAGEDAAPHPEETALTRHRLNEVLGRLANLDQKVVSLLAEGYTHNEIARQTGLSASNVAVRLHRLRLRLGK